MWRLAARSTKIDVVVDDITVIADASPLIGLAAAGEFELLRRLYGTLLVSRAVLDEVSAGGTRAGARELDAALREGWIRAAPTPPETWRFPELGTGEASVLALALARRDALVLMDDAAGRQQAAALGVSVLDLPGMLLEAKRAGLVERIEPILARLARKGFVVPERAAAGVLERAGERDARAG